VNIYLIRHGQSKWQTNETICDNSDLTVIGEKQAIYLNDHIREIIDSEKESSVIHVSPLKRAIQTARSLGRQYKLNVEIKEAPFHVASYLPQFENPHIYNRKLSEEIKYKRFREKVKTAISNILLEEFKNIYCYTHAGVIKTFLRIIHDNDSICYTINNCSITKISWKNSRWHVKMLNQTLFLPKELIT